MCHFFPFFSDARWLSLVIKLSFKMFASVAGKPYDQQNSAVAICDFLLSIFRTDCRGLFGDLNGIEEVIEWSCSGLRDPLSLSLY